MRRPLRGGKAGALPVPGARLLLGLAPTDTIVVPSEAEGAPHV
jgi:hypothetical protein